MINLSRKNKSIFISYRRADSQDVVGRLYDHLVNKFSRKNVFKDVDCIPAGADFRDSIRKEIQRSGVVLVIIGPEWLTATGFNGQRRLEDPDDLVRIEIELALQLNIPIIPVIVRNGTPPRDSELPDSLEQLASHNTIQLRPDPDFIHDMTNLICAIENIIECKDNKLFYKNTIEDTTSTTHSGRQSSSPVLPGTRFSSLEITSLLVACTAASIALALTLLGTANTLARFPFLRTLAIAIVPLSLVIHFVNPLQIRRLKEIGKREQQNARAELTRRLLKRLDKPRLLTPRAVRGLANSIEMVRGCPMLTDTLITEAIRAAALELEDHCDDQDVIIYIEHLNDLLKHINEKAVPLLSLAETDRLYAYVKSEPIFIKCVFYIAGAYWIAIGLLGLTLHWSLSVIASLLLAWQAVLLATNLRATVVWTNNKTSSSSDRSRFEPFLFALKTRNPLFRLLLNGWAAVWEHGEMFEEHLVPRQEFVIRHEFRFDLAHQLWRRLQAIQRGLDNLGPNDISSGLSEEFNQTCRELWIVTGDRQFRLIKERGRITSDDFDTRAIHYLNDYSKENNY